MLFLRRWFCHFDDDNYVNVPALVRKLQEFDPRQDWYLGKPSIPEPLEILDRDNMQVSSESANNRSIHKVITLRQKQTQAN